jgi:hypothetical protein
MNIKRLALTLILASLLSFTTTVAYHVSTKSFYQEEYALPLPSPTSTEPSSPIPTSSPTTPSQEQTRVSFGPCGGFTIISPCNTTYRSNIIAIEIRGQMLVGRNIKLSITYSLDGQERLVFPTVIKQVHDWDYITGAITGSMTLENLPEGQHLITIFADRQFNSSPHLFMGEVYFTVDTSND